jgi:hypothetical protein
MYLFIRPWVWIYLIHIIQTAKVGESLDQNTLMVVAFVRHVKVFVMIWMYHRANMQEILDVTLIKYVCHFVAVNNRKQLIKSISSNAVCMSND